MERSGVKEAAASRRFGQNNRTSFFAQTAILLLSVALIAGCQPSFHSVSGTVTFEGKPVSWGNIMLEPDAAKENRGVPSLALIRDGAFRVSSNVGVLTGPYVITVQGEDPNDRVPATTGNVAPGDETAAMPRKLFPPYSFEHVFSDKESFTLEIVVPHSK